MSKTWLITGVSSGFGYEMTRQLLESGNTVIGTVRNTKKVENLKNPSSENDAEYGSIILVAYFSRSGNTVWEDGVDAVTSASINVMQDGQFAGNAELLAGMARQVTGGDLFLIQTADTYPSGYRDTTDLAKVDQNNGVRPALASHAENMDQYDTIVLVYPNWWGNLPQPLYTFLEEYDFSGKTILPLCTHEGSRMGSTERTIASLCPDATLMDGLAVRGGSAAGAQSEVETWINNSGILRGTGIKLTKKDALKLSRLTPEQQTDAASQLAKEKIRSVDEYNSTSTQAKSKSAEKQPTEQPTPPPLETGYYPTIRDSVADLKNPDKDRSLTPDIFLVTFTFFLQRFGQSVKSYAVNESAAVFPALTLEHLTQIQQEISSVHRALDDLFKLMERLSIKSQAPK